MNHLSTQSEILASYAPHAESYLEIGVQEGLSLLTVLTHGPMIGRVALCDTWGTVSGGSGKGSHDHIEALFGDRELEVRFLDGDSTIVLPHFDDAPFDLVHVDGGHSYEVAFSDLVHGWRLCGMWMVVHDVSFPEVWRALFEFLQSAYATAFDVYVGGHGTAVLTRHA